MPDISDDMKTFCMEIGLVAQWWAMTEQAFDTWVAMIYHRLGGRTEVDPNIYQNFKRKVRFLKKSFRQLETLKGFSDDATPLLNKALTLCGKRNDLIHGILTELKPIDGKWHMVVIDYDTPKDQIHWHKLRHFTVSHSDFRDYEKALGPLAEDVAAFAAYLKTSLKL